MGTRIYVGGLPPDANEKQIRQFVEAEGRVVVAVKVHTDKDTGKARFAFVDLESEEQAKAAIASLNGKDLGGKLVKVNEAQAKGSEPKSAPTGFGGAHQEVERAGGAAKGFGMRGPSQGPSRGSTRGGGRGGGRGS